MDIEKLKASLENAIKRGEYNLAFNQGQISAFSTILGELVREEEKGSEVEVEEGASDE